MEFEVKSQNSSYSIQAIPLLICPYCRKRFPSLKLLPSNWRMDVEVRCPCLGESRVLLLKEFIKSLSTDQAEGNVEHCAIHSTKKAAKYCLKCLQWLCPDCIETHLKLERDHLLNSFELVIECSEHRKAFSHFCMTCLINICDECLVSHQKHSLLYLCPVEYPELQENVFDVIKAKNRERTNALIDKVYKQMESPNSIPEDLLSTCVANESINNDLKQLYQILFRTALVFKSHPSYEHKHLNIFLNTEHYVTKEEKSIKEEYINLKAHLQRSYVLKQVPTNECITTNPIQNGSASVIIQLKDGRLAFACKNLIKLWNLTTNECVTIFITGADNVIDFTQLKDGRLAILNFRGEVILWRATTSHKPFRIVHQLDKRKYCIAELNKNRLGLGGWNYILILSLSKYPGHYEIHTGNRQLNCIVLLSKGRLAIGSSDSTIKLYDLTTNNVALLAGHKEDVNCLIELNDERIASGSDDRSIKLWNTATNKCNATLTGHSQNVNKLVQLSDGRLASASKDTTIKLWNLNPNSCFATLKGHCLSVLSLAQLNDGRLASSSEDKTIKLWNV